MTRNIKALGLALLAAFAFSALAVQTASADTTKHQFATTGEAPTVLTGEQEAGEGKHKFTVGEATLTCEHVTFSGTVSGTEADHVSVVPSYTECHDSSGSVPVTVHVNGCTFTFHSDTEETGEGESATTHAPVDIVCPSGKEITITISEAEKPCVVHVPPQTGLHGVTYTNITENEKDAVTVTATVNDIKATSTGGFICLVSGLSSEVKEHKSVYTGATTVTGFKDLSSAEEGEEHKYTDGEQTNIRVKDLAID